MYPEYDDASTICTPAPHIKQNLGFGPEMAPVLGVFRSQRPGFLGGQNDRFVPQTALCTRFSGYHLGVAESAYPRPKFVVLRGSLPQRTRPNATKSQESRRRRS